MRAVIGIKIKNSPTSQEKNQRMNAALRTLTEFKALNQVLGRREMASVVVACMTHVRSIASSGKLTALDSAMSRNMTVYFDGAKVVLPLADIDKILAQRNDNPTFGNLREIYARNCYLGRLRIKRPVRAVLDLGANRGMFSILALTALGADVAVGVEPVTHYEEVYKLLLKANHCDAKRGPRYCKFLSSPSIERAAPEENVSIQTILREQNIERFNLVKMDIEGHESQAFSEPDWLAKTDTICMELHPETGDLSMIPLALKEYGFKYVLTDQHGKPATMKDATFLYASCTGELAI